MLFLLRKHVNFHFISGPNYKNLRRIMSLETLLPKNIIDFSVFIYISLSSMASQTCLIEKINVGRQIVGIRLI